jgi:hypothetical protein
MAKLSYQHSLRAPTSGKKKGIGDSFNKFATSETVPLVKSANLFSGASRECDYPPFVLIQISRPQIGSVRQTNFSSHASISQSDPKLRCSSGSCRSGDHLGNQGVYSSRSSFWRASSSQMTPITSSGFALRFQANLIASWSTRTTFAPFAADVKKTG